MAACGGFLRTSSTSLIVRACSMKRTPSICLQRSNMTPNFTVLHCNECTVASSPYMVHWSVPDISRMGWYILDSSRPVLGYSNYPQIDFVYAHAYCTCFSAVRSSHLECTCAFASSSCCECSAFD